MKKLTIILVCICLTGCILLGIYEGLLPHVSPIADVILYIVIMMCIVGILQSSVGEMGRSSKDLIRERDVLEIKVNERTEELKNSQAERAAELSRIAEFGRLSQGLFHDLMTPLTSLALHVERLKSLEMQKDALRDTQTHVEKAVRASERMGAFMKNIRRNISQDGTGKAGKIDETSICDVAYEATLVADLLSYKARENGSEIKIVARPGIAPYPANPFYFYQIFLNLISNAIEAHGINDPNNVNTKEADTDKIIRVNINAKSITIADSGPGIRVEHIEKIFEPFFTTKPTQAGSGIGLSTVQTIVSEKLGGTITADNWKKENGEIGGAIFTISLP